LTQAKLKGVKMRPFKALISVAEARRIMVENVRPIVDAERVATPKAVGRVLSRDVTAPIDVPPFSRSAMDGYAVRASETFGASRSKPVTLRLVGSLHAGSSEALAVDEGECVQVATGSMVPQGADAVVMVEDTHASHAPSAASARRRGARDSKTGAKNIRVERAVPPGANISERGLDVRQGSKVLEAGAELTPARVGVLTSLGIGRVEVFRKVIVAVIPTGTEVADLGAKLAPGQIYDSNSYTLSSLFESNGALVNKYAIVPDKLEKLVATMKKATSEADIVILSGGSSVGERDLLVDAVEKLGKILYHGVQIKPGKPILCAVVAGKLVVGLPGYPVSCLSNGYIFILPVLRRLQGLPPPVERTVRAKMGERISASLGRLVFLTVRLRDGKVYTTYKESGALTSMAEADGYVEIPENVDYVEEGEEVIVKLW
jgi:molybdenum cofactor synthesis domain-containing protein